MSRGARTAAVRQAGASFVELVAAVSIVGIALLVMLQQLTISYRETETNNDRLFAYQKAMALLAELQAKVERGDVENAAELEDYDDEGREVPVLTTLTGGDGMPFAPDHVMSGNRTSGGAWQWTRRIDVEEVPGLSRARYVRVRVLHRGGGGRSETLATVGSLLNVPPRPYDPVQVHDVYVLACGETPSLWLPLASLRATFTQVADALAATSRGAQFRLHWITRLGYGRDPLYVPFLNVATSASEAAPWTYWYPGRIDESPGALYVPEYFTGRIRTEAGVRNDWDAARNPHPHAVADRHNHCLREPEAMALWEARVAAGLEDPKAPPLQVLLELMHREPARFRNAIFVNLHGEGLPFPPLRNHSDPAIAPEVQPWARAVTHPARLRPARDPNGDGDHADTEDCEFRVYAWNWRTYGVPAAEAEVLNAPILLQIPGVDLSRNVNAADPTLPATLLVRRCPGWVDPAGGGARPPYESFDSPAGLPPRAPSAPREMWFEVGYESSPPHTWIRLHNTPLVQPMLPAAGGAVTGIAAPQHAPYNLHYVPSAVVGGAGGTFARDLATVAPADAPARNTARWRIRIPRAAFQPGFPGGTWADRDVRVTVVTRIGADPTTGRAWPAPHQPRNRSATYAWWAATTEAVPLTERWQLLGDPRHNPYVDLMAGGRSFPHGYNWHWDDLAHAGQDHAASWPGLHAARLADGFGERVRADAPRMLQLLRGTLQRCGATFVNPYGAPARVLLLGGEIALPPAAPGGAFGRVKLHGAWAGRAGPVGVDTISAPPADAAGVLLPETGTCTGQHEVVSSWRGAGELEHWLKPQLGELAPDDWHARWAGTGNLPAADGGAPCFVRRPLPLAQPADFVAAHGLFFGGGASQVLGEAGTTAWFDAGTLAATWRHVPAGELMPAAAPAVEIGAALKTTLPQSWFAGATLDVEAEYAGPLPYFAFADSYPKSAAALLEPFYAQAGAAGAATLLVDGGARGVMLHVGNGFTPWGGVEHDTVCRSALAAALRAFHRAGSPGTPGRVRQLPRLEIVAPEADGAQPTPSFVQLRWKADWLRFDGQRYTADYPAGFTEAEADLRYVWLYSSDRGATWRHAADHSPAVPGARPADADLLLRDAAPGPESWLWPTPADAVPAGEYLLRVDCHHATRGQHLSSHQVRFLILRQS
jgi:hypothetical protein